jgi:hypothetical protein
MAGKQAAGRSGRSGRSRKAGPVGLVKHTIRWPLQLDRDLRAMAAHRGLTVGELIEPALRSGLLYGFSLTVQEPDRRAARPQVEVWREPAAGEGSDLAG